ncbi:MAG: retropepsin-like aspartic protease [Patescibacteria group bacterium]
MKFKYKRYGSILRPVIEITLKNQNKYIRYEVLVDSGADLCLFDEEIGSYLGINIKKGKPKEVFGVGGKCSLFYVHPITIEVGGWPFEINAGFMPSVAGKVMPYGLVGQNGFFENFIIKFDLLKEEIEVRNREKH